MRAVTEITTRRALEHKPSAWPYRAPTYPPRAIVVVRGLLHYVGVFQDSQVSEAKCWNLAQDGQPLRTRRSPWGAKRGGYFLLSFYCWPRWLRF